MEKSVFTAAAVAAELKSNFVEARLHCDGKANIERIKELQRELAGTIANPYFVIIDPTNEEKLSEGSFMTTSKFESFLKGARS